MVATPPWQKEAFSVAYVSAWAAHAGITVAHSMTPADMEAVDIILRCGGLSVDLQLKCTSSPQISANGDFISFPLDNRAYRLLSAETRTAEAYLALVIAPEEALAWIEPDDSSILMRGSGYYMRMTGLGEPTGVEHTVVRIPTTQRIDLAGLKVMFDQAEHRALYGVRGSSR